MKVKDIVKKINYATAGLPVYVQEGAFGKSRKLVSFDYADYFYDEKDRTVWSISVRTDRVIIHYK